MQSLFKGKGVRMSEFGAGQGVCPRVCVCVRVCPRAEADDSLPLSFTSPPPLFFQCKARAASEGAFVSFFVACAGGGALRWASMLCQLSSGSSSSF